MLTLYYITLHHSKNCFNSYSRQYSPLSRPSASFNTTDYLILLDRLKKSFGIHDLAFSWFQLHLFGQSVRSYMPFQVTHLYCQGIISFSPTTSTYFSTYSYHSYSFLFLASHSNNFLMILSSILPYLAIISLAHPLTWRIFLLSVCGFA